MTTPAMKKKDNTVRNILIFAAIMFGLAVLAVAAVPFMHGFMDSIRRTPLFR